MNVKVIIKFLVTILCLIFFHGFITSAYAEIQQEDTLLEICENASIDDYVGQLLIVGLPNIDYTNYKDRFEVNSIICDLGVGGIMLNTYNFYVPNEEYNSIGQFEYLKRIQAMIQYFQILSSTSSTKLPLFTSVDFESNFTSIKQGLDLPPSALTIGHMSDPKLIKDLGQMVGNELKVIGVNMIFGPVLDTPENVNGIYSTTLSNRYFSNRADITSDIALKFLEGLESSHIFSIVKHFPGYCDIDGNPHTDLTYFNGNINTIENNIKIYDALKDHYDGLMTANYYFDNSSNQRPLIFSRTLLSLLNRNNNNVDNNWVDFNFDLSNKLVISDDLSNMKIVESYRTKNNYSYSDIAIQAFNSGHDILLFSHFGKNGTIGNFELDDLEEVKKALSDHIKNNPEAEKHFREALYRILSKKSYLIGDLDQTSSFLSSDNSDIFNSSSYDISSLTNSYKNNQDLIVKSIKNGAVLLNLKNKVPLENKHVLVIGTNPKFITDGIQGLPCSIDSYSIEPYYKESQDLERIVEDIHHYISEDTITIFVTESKDHATIVQQLYLNKIVSNENLLVLNHYTPNIFDVDDFVKNVTIFNTMSKIDSSYIVDLHFLTTDSQWSDVLRINLGKNKSINDVLYIDYNPIDVNSKLDIHSSNNEEKMSSKIDLLCQELDQRDTHIKNLNSTINSLKNKYSTANKQNQTYKKLIFATLVIIAVLIIILIILFRSTVITFLNEVLESLRKIVFFVISIFTKIQTLLDSIYTNLTKIKSIIFFIFLISIIFLVLIRRLSLQAIIDLINHLHLKSSLG